MSVPFGNSGHIYNMLNSINPLPHTRFSMVSKMGAWPGAGGCCNCVVTPVLNRFRSI